MCILKRIQLPVLIILISTINVEALIRESKFCSTNKDCASFQLASSNETICGIRDIPKSGLVACRKGDGNNLTCSESCTVCVNNIYWETPVCYPLALANAKVCPRVVDDSTVIGSLGNTDVGWEIHKPEVPYGPNGYCRNQYNMDEANGVTPYGGRILAWTDNAHGCGKIYFRVVMYFTTINQLSASTKIKSAKLRLLGTGYELGSATFAYYPGYTGSFTNEVLIRRIVTAWNMSKVSWNTQPLVTDVNEVMIPATKLSYFYNVTMDVTAMVQDMIDSKQNHGFMLVLKYEEPYRMMSFYLPNQDDIAKQARLIIDY